MPDNSHFITLKKNSLILGQIKVDYKWRARRIDEYFWCAIARIWQWHHPAILAICRLYPTYSYEKPWSNQGALICLWHRLLQHCVCHNTVTTFSPRPFFSFPKIYCCYPLTYNLTNWKTNNFSHKSNRKLGPNTAKSSKLDKHSMLWFEIIKKLSA